jgi:hypothetical protein
MKVRTSLEALMPTSTVEHREPIGAGPALTDFVVTVDQEELHALGEGAFGRADLGEFTHAVVWGLILLRTLERAGTYSGDVDDDRAHLHGLIRALERTLLPRLAGVRDAAVRWHSKLGGSHGDLAAAMDVARSTAQSRVQALLDREPSEGEQWATGQRRAPEAPAKPHTVTIDLMDGEHTHWVLTEALQAFAHRQHGEADQEAAEAAERGEDCDRAAEHRREWAAAAEALLARINDAL